MYAGTAAATVIGGENRDRVILVRYPGTSAFLGMVESPAYRDIVHHRSGALLDSRLYLTIRDPA